MILGYVVTHEIDQDLCPCLGLELTDHIKRLLKIFWRSEVDEFSWHWCFGSPVIWLKFMIEEIPRDALRCLLKRLES